MLHQSGCISFKVLFFALSTIYFPPRYVTKFDGVLLTLHRPRANIVQAQDLLEPHGASKIPSWLRS